MKNLKRITLAVLALASTATINAQENDSDKENSLRIGVKAGLNYSNVYDERGDDLVADGKFGLAGGAFLSIPIGDFFGIQPEFLFSQKGFKATGSVVGLNYELTRTSTFIDVPLFFAVRPVPFITILAGPQFSYLINQKDEFTSSVSSFAVEQEFENDNIRKNIMCFVGGIDINVSHIVIGARAGFDFQDNAGDGTNSTPRYKNVWYQATVGIRF